MPTTIGVIGTGNMGSALVRGWLRSGDKGVRLVVWDKVETAMRQLLSPGTISPAGSLEDLVARSDVVLLVVKPKDAPEVLDMIAPLLRLEQIVVSSMAGVALEHLRALLGPGPRLFRVMPNLGVELGAGTIAVAGEPGATAADTGVVLGLFRSLGVTESVPENMLDAVTALSGSGPAFLALAVESLEDGAVASGLPRAAARRLVRQTALSTARSLPLHAGDLVESGEDSDAPPQEVAVSDALEKEGPRSAFRRAIEAAVERSIRLRDA